MDFPRPLSSAHQPRHYSHHHLLLPLLLLSILRACTAQLLVEENAGIAYPLSPRATTVAAPIGFSPDQNWDGIDGQWSSFTLAIGSPQQFVRTFVSTASQQIWAIDPIGCKGGCCHVVVLCRSYLVSARSLPCSSFLFLLRVATYGWMHMIDRSSAMLPLVFLYA